MLVLEDARETVPDSSLELLLAIAECGRKSTFVIR